MSPSFGAKNSSFAATTAVPNRSLARLGKSVKSDRGLLIVARLFREVNRGKTRRPPTYVARTTPKSSRAAYGRDAMAVTQRRRINDERGVRVPDHNVGVVICDDRACSGCQAGQPSRVRHTSSRRCERDRHLARERPSTRRTTTVVSTRFRPKPRRSHPRFCFNFGGQGEWSDATRSISPSINAFQRASRSVESLIGGAHLYSVAPSGISSAAKGQIVWTGLDR
jgi:hypothetical protein